MLLYYITDRRGFAGTDAEQRCAVLRHIATAAQAGVDLIQLREKDLSPRALELLGREAVRAVRDNSQTTRLLINHRTDVALSCGADGVHLPSGELPASEVRVSWMKASLRAPVTGVSGHTVAEIRYAEAHGADFAVLAPIFEKVQTGTGGIGLDVLSTACLGTQPPGNTEAGRGSRFAVLALGGVNVTNAGACIAAGAAGIAGIRLFQEGDLASRVRRLRETAQDGAITAQRASR
jgi:thiamine-phosphate pyrophosphorylase